MLTGVRILVVGGDARQLEVIQKFIELDAALTLIGFEELTLFENVPKEKLYNETLQRTDVVILPAVGTDENGFVESIYSRESIVLLSEHIESLPSHAKIYTGLARSYLKKLCASHDIDIVELFDRDDVAIYNSIPTAEGTLMMAMQNTDFTIHGSKSVVLGMGRSGLTLARLLKALGSHVKVGVRRPEHYARAWEMGFEPFYLTELSQQVRHIDLLFNTIPTMIVTAQVIANMQQNALILDIASKPGGTDFRYADKRGIKAILAPGLPGIVAPRTAGQIIANCLSQLIMEDLRGRGN